MEEGNVEEGGGGGAGRRGGVGEGGEERGLQGLLLLQKK